MSAPKHVTVRHDRKWPRFVVTYTDGLKTYHTLRVSHDTADKLCEEMNVKIAYGAFKVDNYLPGGHPSANIDMISFAKKYLTFREKEVRIGRIRPKTLEKDMSSIKIFIRFAGKNTMISSIKVKFVDDFVMYLKNSNSEFGRPYSVHSINSYLKSLSGFFTFGANNNLLESNPLHKYPTVKDEDSGGKESDDIRVLSSEEQDEFREYCSNNVSTTWVMDLFELALRTGARRDELFWLKSNCLVTPKISKGKSFLIVYGKGRKFRKIPVDDVVVSIIEKRKELLQNKQQIESYLDNMVDNRDYLPLFKKRVQDGYLFWEISRSDRITKKFGKIFANVCIEDANFHTLRKTFATEALDSGKSMEWVKEVLGHSSIRVTESTYGQITIKKILAEMV